MVVSLPLSAAEFNPDKQKAFRDGVASFAGVPVSKVEITVKDENTGNLATSVEVRPSSANHVHIHPTTCRGAIHCATDTSSSRSDSHY
jgi:hypothetical protein